MKPVAILWSVIGMAFACESQAQARIYTKPHDLMVLAIKSGSAAGVLTGQVDEHFTRQFRSTGPLLVTAKVIQNLGRADCKRLEVIYTKKDVDTPKGRTDAILTTQMNYCLDGGPPLPEGAGE